MLNSKTWKWEHPPTSESTPAGRQRHTAALVRGRLLVVIGGFDGFRWLGDLHLLDLGKWEDSAIAMSGVFSLLSDLGSLVNNPASFPDVTFVVDSGGAQVVGHRAILAARCPYFKAMFSHGMRESTQAVIELKEDIITRDAFLALLWWIYTGAVPDLQPETALDALGVAQYFAVDGLKSLCESVLLPLVDAGNVTALLLAGQRYGATDLKRFCMDFVFKHASSVSAGHPLSSGMNAPQRPPPANPLSHAQSHSSTPPVNPGASPCTAAADRHLPAVLGAAPAAGDDTGEHGARATRWRVIGPARGRWCRGLPRSSAPGPELL